MTNKASDLFQKRRRKVVEPLYLINCSFAAYVSDRQAPAASTRASIDAVLKHEANTGMDVVFF